MEVHPPHEPVHSWREALIHIGLMTIGLFIALMLEGLVEYLHHKHLVHEARENIRAELQHNHEAAQKDMADLDKESAHIQSGIDTLHFMHTHPKAHGSISFAWSYVELSDAAWRSARDTGAMGYMPYETVKSFADLYGEQALLIERMRNLQFHEAEIIAPMAAVGDDETIPQGEYNAMLIDAARTQLDLQILGQSLKGLDHTIVEELKQL